ncbi:hypothetical protein L227DRAFT_581607 [Lentinus tigrinus ALCF2SS1-6]|uniref:Uncharacterized protein n=1 Tax=Lentinus tigrinus ALCF2SS1-6 TaxID=1328759 RepID=A0A5C2RNB9_9APHY|nr:hypothetical protein L227DRAFT_581607 [Lentinus tigrinus ALCF2SS1-6]
MRPGPSQLPSWTFATLPSTRLAGSGSQARYCVFSQTKAPRELREFSDEDGEVFGVCWQGQDKVGSSSNSPRRRREATG